MYNVYIINSWLIGGFQDFKVRVVWPSIVVNPHLDFLLKIIVIKLNIKKIPITKIFYEIMAYVPINIQKDLEFKYKFSVCSLQNVKNS